MVQQYPDGSSSAPASREQSQRLGKHLSNSTTLMLPGSGHMLHYTGAGKKAILEAVRRFTALEENASRSELGISKWNNAIANAVPALSDG
jgi:hypothetical protein